MIDIALAMRDLESGNVFSSKEAPPKKQRVKEDSASSSSPAEWKCAGNVLLGEENPGCAHEGAERAAATKVKGRGTFDTCKGCKRDMQKWKRQQKRQGEK